LAYWLVTPASLEVAAVVVVSVVVVSGAEAGAELSMLAVGADEALAAAAMAASWSPLAQNSVPSDFCTQISLVCTTLVVNESAKPLTVSVSAITCFVISCRAEMIGDIKPM